jgi:hypothetical protein
MPDPIRETAREENVLGSSMESNGPNLFIPLSVCAGRMLGESTYNERSQGARRAFRAWFYWGAFQ